MKLTSLNTLPVNASNNKALYKPQFASNPVANTVKALAGGVTGLGLNAVVSQAPRVLSQTSIENSDLLYNAASRFLTLPQWFEKTVLVPLQKNPKANPIRLKLANVATVFLDHDYVKRISMFNWGKVAIRPPLGSLGLIIYLGAMPSRLYAASLRPDTDKGEYLDIIIRDLVSISAFVFWLDPMRKFTANMFKHFGRSNTLSYKNEIFSYNEMDTLYRLTHPNRLLSLVSRRSRHKRVVAALETTLKNKNFVALMKQKPEIARNVEAFTAVFKQMRGFIVKDMDNNYEKVHGHPELRKLANKGYDLAQKIETGIINYLKKNAGTKIGHIPSFKNAFAAAGSQGRLWIDLISFAAVTAFLGFGVTWFNEWFTAWRTGEKKNV